MPPKDVEMFNGKFNIENIETGEVYEFDGLKEVNLTGWDEPTASARWNDDGFYNASFDFSMDISKWKDYKLWLKILGVDYNELTFRYKLEFIFYFIIDKIKNLKR